MNLRTLFRRLQCTVRGHDPQFFRNVYGDQIMVLKCRSMWRCSHCEAFEFRQQLHGEGK